MTSLRIGKVPNPADRADGAEYADDAELEDCACPCGTELFQITAGVHLYADSSDVKLLCSPAPRAPSSGPCGAGRRRWRRGGKTADVSESILVND